MARRIVIDLDGTLTLDVAGVAYPDKPPNLPVIAALRRYREAGFEIVVMTARNMRTHAANIGRINALTLPGVIAWLDRHGVPYDEIHVGKPWCGTEGFYVDDRAVRPSELLAHDHAGLLRLLAREAEGMVEA
ncbi:MAG: capsular biosynthesis protein [Alphaproteobacteria bacterium]